MPLTGTNFKKATETCLACATACESYLDTCLGDGGSVEIEGDGIRKLMDCATICRVTATLLARGSGIATDQCRVCIEACLRCETECGRAGGEEAKDCARACNACEDALRAIA